MKSRNLWRALLAVALAWGGGACGKGEAPGVQPRGPGGSAPPEAAPTAGGSPEEGSAGPGAAARVTADTGGGAAGAPAGKAEGAPVRGGEGAAPGGGAPAEERGTTDCEAGRSFDEASIAVQKAKNARVDAESAVARAAAAQHLADELVIARMQSQASLCSARTLDGLCVGAATGDPTRCKVDRVQDDDQSCVRLAAMRRAVVSHDAAACAGIGYPPMEAVCVGGLTGKYPCKDDDTKEWALCRRLASGADLQCPENAADDNMCGGYWTMRALLTQDAVPCGRIRDRWPRDKCRALATGDVSLCAMQGTVPERCREVIVDADLDETTAAGRPRYSVRLRATNRYLEAAVCSAVLQLDAGGRTTRIERSLGTLDPNGKVQVFEWNLGDMDDKPLLTATTQCTWVPASVPNPAPPDQP